jgi:hypothetical protein
MTNDTSKSSANQPNPGAQQSARTDDLLASGADSADGARGFDSKADPQALQTGMEGIAEATSSQGNRQSDSHNSTAASQTLPDNQGQLRSEQKSS